MSSGSIKTYLDSVGNLVHILYADFFNGEQVPLAGLVYEEDVTVKDFNDPPEYACYMSAIECVKFLMESGYGGAFKI